MTRIRVTALAVPVLDVGVVVFVARVRRESPIHDRSSLGERECSSLGPDFRDNPLSCQRSGHDLIATVGVGALVPLALALHREQAVDTGVSERLYQPQKGEHGG